MKAIEVVVNGQRICLAGTGGDNGFTFANLTIYESGDQIGSLAVAGSRDKTVPRWIDDHAINEGDELVLRVIQVNEADPPIASSSAWTEFPRVKLDE